METNGSISSSHESQPSDVTHNTNKDKAAEKIEFINHAERAWQERRKEWVGDQSEITTSAKEPRAWKYFFNVMKEVLKDSSFLSWTTTYEDLLLTTEPFQEPIPLAEMVDFLVDIWLEEGLYD